MAGNVTKTGPGSEITRPDDYDPYAAYGEKVGMQGLFLSFKNNEYLYGQEGDSLELGTRIVANMPGLRIGWRRWWEAKVTDDLTELLSDMVPVQQRNTLGDNDEELWEHDDQGQPRDPWQLTNILEMVDAEGERYIYSTASKGGINAIGRLCKAYGKLRRQKPGLLPIVELKSNFYMHPKYGKTYTPEFPIVGWVDADTLEPEEAAEEPIPFDPGTGEVKETTPAPAKAQGKPAARGKAAAKADANKPRF